ncbi:MAG: hypothetical protein PHW02_03190 [bacterium]|nr:hypothetical protein [bacterium]
MKKTITAFLLIASLLIAGEDWQKSFDASFLMNLNNYSQNWAGEEASSFNWVINGNGNFSKQLYAFLNTSNRIKLSFGQTTSKLKTDSVWGDAMKSTDVIDFESIEKVTLNWLVDPFIGIRLESQFLDESDTMKTCYVNPMKITESFGIARIVYKKDKLEVSSRLGAAIKQNVNRNALIDSTRGFDMTNNGGIEFITDALVPFKENVTYTGRLSLYKALFYSEAEALIGLPNENDWKVIDAAFDNILAIKLGEYLAVNINVQALYDKEIDAKTRLKETVGVGINYKFL